MPRPEDYGGNQTLTPDGVQKLLSDVRQSAGRGNPPIRGIDIYNQMRAKNAGFPKFMYPPLDSPLRPECVYKIDEQIALEERGYTMQYQVRNWPHMIHRRNMSKKFAGELDNGDPDPSVHPYIESRVCKSKDEFDALNKQKQNSGVGPWKMSLLEVEPLEEGGEDPALVIARLEGQLAEARKKAEKAA